MADDISRLPSDHSDSRSMALLPGGGLEHTNGELNGAAYFGPSTKAGAADPTIYLHALRRRWLMVLGIGLLFAAIAGPLVWFGIGDQYTATAYLQVSMVDPTIVEETNRSLNSPDRFEIFKNSQRQNILSPFVLMAALRKTEVRNISVIQWEWLNGDAVKWLSDSLKVDFPGRAEMMTVSLSLDNPKDAQTLVKAVVDSYMNGIVNEERDKKQKRLTQLEKVCSDKEQSIRAKRDELLRSAKVEGFNSMDPGILDTRQRLALEELAIIRRQQSNTQFAMSQLEGDLAAQKALLENVDKTDLPALEMDMIERSDPQARQLAMELGLKKLEEAYTIGATKENVQSQYASRPHREVEMLQKQYDARMEELRKKARDSKRAQIGMEILRLETLIGSIKTQQEALKNEIIAKVEEAKKFGIVGVDIQMLLADIKQQEMLATKLTGERDQLKVELQAPQRITMIGAVEEPTMRSNTLMRVVLTLMAVLGGFALPATAITFFDAQSGRINTTADVSKKLRVPVIGSVPRIPAQVIHRLASPSKRHRSWHLRLTESVDGIAARLLCNADLKQSRVIMVSSATGGEGKTTLTTQLALSLARTGRRTVLVDFDLRRPSFDEVFGLPLAPGVSEMLRGQCSVDELVHQSATENLWVVTAGQWDRQALASLSNGSASALFKSLRETFEFVVVDSSPILPVADARFVSQQVDTVVLSVFRDISQAPKIQAACDILTAFGVQSVEAVVTGLNEHSYGKHMGYESTVNA